MLEAIVNGAAAVPHGISTEPEVTETFAQSQSRLTQTKSSVKRMHRPERMAALIRGEAKVSDFWARLVTLR